MDILIACIALSVSIIALLALVRQERHSARVRVVERVLSRLESIEMDYDNPMNTVLQVRAAWLAISAAPRMDEAKLRVKASLHYANAWRHSISQQETDQHTHDAQCHAELFGQSLRSSEFALEGILYSAAFDHWWQPIGNSSNYGERLVPIDPEKYSAGDGRLRVQEIYDWITDSLGRES